MILVIGKENCGRCEMTKTILNNKAIEYEYILMENLPQEEKQTYMNKARSKGMLSFPIIIKNEEVVDIKEVI